MKLINSLTIIARNGVPEYALIATVSVKVVALVATPIAEVVVRCVKMKIVTESGIIMGLVVPYSLVTDAIEKIAVKIVVIIVKKQIVKMICVAEFVKNKIVRAMEHITVLGAVNIFAFGAVKANVRTIVVFIVKKAIALIKIQLIV